MPPPPKVSPHPQSNERAVYLITGEYPPSAGGVADYTRLVANSLAEAGRVVHVIAPGEDGTQREGAITVHRVAGRFAGAGLRRASRVLDEGPEPRQLVLQWVPHAFGWRSMNIAACWWIYRRATRHHDRVDLMVHEAAFAFEGSWKQWLAAVVHRVMLVLLLRAASRVFVSTEEWTRLCRPFALGRRLVFAAMPVPSTIAHDASEDAVRALRQRLAPRGERIVAHFGTYGTLVTATLQPIMSRLLDADPDCRVLLLGAGGDRFRDQLASSDADRARRIHAPGALGSTELSAHLGCADVFVQPYPDGVSARRTSAMAVLAHGRALVTTRGKSTEPVWSEGAVALVPAVDVEAVASGAIALLHDDAARGRLAAAGLSLYERHFDVRHTVRALLAPAT